MAPRRGGVPGAVAVLFQESETGGRADQAQHLLGSAFEAIGDCAVLRKSAREIGLVNAIVPAEELRAHALGKAKALAAKPRAALLATRRLMRGDQEALYAHMERELGEFWRALR